MSSPIRHCENDDAGARLTYEAIDFDDAAQRDWLVADLRRAADDPGTERPQWWIEAPDDAADNIAAAAGWERVRTLVQLRRPLPLDPPPQVPGLRTFDADRDIDAWLALNNEAFAWHPDQGHQKRAGLAIELAAPWVDFEGFFAVSYTHLDVYKRQAHYSELLDQDQRIIRPRQVYIGADARDYVPFSIR